MGCPVPTIEHHAREGHIKRRPRSGNRPTLNRASVEQFADQWQAKQAARAERRKKRDMPAPSKRVPPEDTGWLHADEVVELTGLGRPRVGQLATLGILPAQWSGHQHLWFREDQTRRWHEARAADAEQWISWRAAADLIGCSTAVVSAAAQRGEIERREANRTAPSLRRSSVEAFAQRWPDLAQQHKDRQDAAARRRDELRRRTQPPDHDHVWLSRTAAALVLGVSPARFTKLTTDGKIPHTRVGARVWYRRDHVEHVTAARAFAKEQAARRLRARRPKA